MDKIESDVEVAKPIKSNFSIENLLKNDTKVVARPYPENVLNNFIFHKYENIHSFKYGGKFFGQPNLDNIVSSASEPSSSGLNNVDQEDEFISSDDEINFEEDSSNTESEVYGRFDKHEEVSTSSDYGHSTTLRNPGNDNIICSGITK